MPPDAARVVEEPIRFGEDFEVDLRARRLRRGSDALKVERIPLEILILLLEHSGEVVTRDEIVAKVWGKSVFLDTDNSIRGAIRKIRQVLHDDPENPRFIQTITGHGYRFIAPVISPATKVADVLPFKEKTEGRAPAPMHSSGEGRPKTLFADRRLVLGVAAGLVLVGLAYVVYRNHRTATGPKIQSLAVLPLENLSGDPGQEYFSDGMTEAIIGRLSKIGGLRVISRTSVMRFKGTHTAVPEIAKLLGVDAIVEGSVIREGNRVRVTVQLIRGTTDEHIWAEEYDREYQGILALDAEVAQTIAHEIKITMTPQEQAGVASRHTVDVEANEDYLKGTYYLNQTTAEQVKKSVAYFQQALSRDPTYGLAYCGLADAYALLGYRGNLPPKDARSQAKAAALKAVELDDTLAPAHASLAFIAETEWDWARAEREFKRSLELDPGYARAHHWYAGYLMYVGRLEKGLVEARRARDLDPLSLPVNNALAGRLMTTGRVDEAVKQLQKTLELNRYFAPAHQTLGWAYLKQGKHEAAIREFEQALQISGGEDTYILVDLGYAYAAAGDRAKADEILAKVKNRHEQGLIPSGSMAILYGALADLDQAFAWLDKAYAEHDPELTYLKVGWRFDPLRRDPRFEKMLIRMGLPPEESFRGR
jgi:TolB-like protein/DNA-binding winged helix-turn-helix (wHTH) protein